MNILTFSRHCGTDFHLTIHYFGLGLNVRRHKRCYDLAQRDLHAGRLLVPHEAVVDVQVDHALVDRVGRRNVDQAREQLAIASSAIGIYRLLCDMQSDG